MNHVYQGIEQPCPTCRSFNTVPQYTAQRVGGVLGAIAGAAMGAVSGGFNGALDSDTSASDGKHLIQMAAGAVMGALLTSTTGCRIGATLGETLDDTVLHRWACRSCGCAFSIRGQSKFPHQRTGTHTFSQTHDINQKADWPGDCAED